MGSGPAEGRSDDSKKPSFKGASALKRGGFIGLAVRNREFNRAYDNRQPLLFIAEAFLPFGQYELGRLLLSARNVILHVGFSRGR